MANARSPQYPQIGLSEAIDKARLVWSKDYQSELPRAVIAEHMGYGSLNGKSLGIIAAVSRYGLLEGRGDATRVTDLAVRILAHQTGDSERAEAVLEAASAPALFREITEKFDGRSPSDQALRSYLLTRGFTLNGAEGVNRSYRETESFIAAETKGVDAEGSEKVVDAHSEPANLSTSAAATPSAEEEPSVIVPISPVASGVPTISMSDEGLVISAGVITSMSQFERLLKRLRAGKILLEEDESEFDD